MRKSNRQDAPDEETRALAGALHTAALRLLRRLRAEDRSAGLSAPALSVLSVVVFSPGLAQRSLAEIEQISAPALSRLVGELTHAGLVETSADPQDRRIKRLTATEAGRRILLDGRDRRVERLTGELADLSTVERTTLREAAKILTRINEAAANA